MKLTDQQKKALIKRSADFLEKMSIASLAVGVFQGNHDGLWLAGFCVVACVFLTYFLET